MPAISTVHCPNDNLAGTTKGGQHSDARQAREAAEP